MSSKAGYEYGVWTLGKVWEDLSLESGHLSCTIACRRNCFWQKCIPLLMMMTMMVMIVNATYIAASASATFQSISGINWWVVSTTTHADVKCQKRRRQSYINDERIVVDRRFIGWQQTSCSLLSGSGWVL